MRRLAISAAVLLAFGILAVVIKFGNDDSNSTATIAPTSTSASIPTEDTPKPAGALSVKVTAPDPTLDDSLQPQELDFVQGAAPAEVSSDQAANPTSIPDNTKTPTSTGAKSPLTVGKPAAEKAPAAPAAPPSTAAAKPKTPQLSLSAKQNLDLLLSQTTRNTDFDDNKYRDVPSSQIAVGDLTVSGDLYDEELLDTSVSGFFRAECEISHFGYDDPIVFPGQPGKSHLHMYFGNTNTNAFSTYDSMMNTGTGSCNGEDLNRTGYWVPALLDRDGNALLPYEVMVYYKNENYSLDGANELVSPFPPNLRMITGNARATAPQTELTGDQGSERIVTYSCGPQYETENPQSLIPDCSGAGNALEIKVAFGACYNEAAGTYRADQSHVSFPDGGFHGIRCPGSHSTDLSSVMYRIFYDPAHYGGSLNDLHLSSDVRDGKLLPGGTTMHADWFGAWHRKTMDLWVANCNNTHADCEIGLLGRNPPISMVKRKQGFFESGYRVPAAELVKLCPGKTLNKANPVVSVSHCR